MSADLAIGSHRINLNVRNAALLGGIIDLGFDSKSFGYETIPVAVLADRIQAARRLIPDTGAVSKMKTPFWVEVGLRAGYWTDLFDRIDNAVAEASPNATATILL